jgi:LmbE family N-acetylglucosaminyl deacetylase
MNPDQLPNNNRIRIRGKMNKVLVVVAHPDDEVLGVGGTLARHADEGDDVYVIFMSEGVSSRTLPGQKRDWSPDIKSREKMAYNSCNVLGIKIYKFLRHPNLRMRDCAVLDMVKEIEEAILKIQPNIIYTHHFGDLNSDHTLTHEIVMTACRPTEGYCVKKIFAFETPSSTAWASQIMAAPFHPNCFVDISSYLKNKLKALMCYDFEMRPYPHPRSSKAIDALACYHGSNSGLHAAEALTVIREIY